MRKVRDVRKVRKVRKVMMVGIEDDGDERSR